jgi:hydroxybutyrate-dimer hydrolase
MNVRPSLHRILPASLALLLGACATAPAPDSARSAVDEAVIIAATTAHRDSDDLLSAGLGLVGLQAPTPPAVADAAAPTAAELRRRAVWANWRGIAWLRAEGIGALHADFPHVEGREFHALLRLPGAAQPHRVLLQLPDRYPGETPCLVVAASSGSRGIYGAIALAGGWGLPRGCAVAYTDKGAGTDWVVPPATHGAGLDGRPASAAAQSAFAPAAASTAVAVKHLHSGDNPEALWGAFVRQAALWAQARLREQFPAAPAPRMLVTGLSNGGGAVLQAAGLAEWAPDAAVAVAPNVLPGEGGRPLYDVITEAALWLPCALREPRFADAPLAPDAAAGDRRCTQLAAAGLIPAEHHASAPGFALRQLLAAGWSEPALRVAATSQRFDLFRAVAAGYASAYTRRSADAMPCGFAYRLADVAALPTLWADSSGIPPGAGVLLEDRLGAGDDAAFAGLRCLRALWEGDTEDARALREAVAATRVALPPKGLPLWVLHGEDDGLVPIMFTAAPYVAWLQANGRTPVFQPLPKAQHFDAFLPLPGMQAYRPLLPPAWAALDAAWERIGARPR